MDTINVLKTKAIDKIRSTRKSIDDFLNDIEQEFLDELETKHSKLNSRDGHFFATTKTENQ